MAIRDNDISIRSSESAAVPDVHVAAKKTLKISFFLLCILDTLAIKSLLDFEPFRMQSNPAAGDKSDVFL